MDEVDQSEHQREEKTEDPSDCQGEWTETEDHPGGKQAEKGDLANDPGKGEADEGPPGQKAVEGADDAIGSMIEDAQWISQGGGPDSCKAYEDLMSNPDAVARVVNDPGISVDSMISPYVVRDTSGDHPGEGED